MFLAVAMQLDQTYQSSESFHSQQIIQLCAQCIEFAIIDTIFCLNSDHAHILV